MALMRIPSVKFHIDAIYMQIGPDFRQPDSVARRAADALAKRTSNPVAVHQKFEDLRAMNIEGKF